VKKFLIYSDCHFSQYSSIVRSMGDKYSKRLHNLIKSISWAESLADQYNCDGVINLGDFFDRPDLNPMEITALQDVYFCNRPHTIITGNHDANISNLEFSSVQIFKSMDAKVITKPEVEKINNFVSFCYVPYLTEDKKTTLREITSDINSNKVVVFSHNEIAGLRYGKIISQSGFNINDIIESCDLFVNGHLHNSGFINDKILLAGNLTGQNFNEDSTKYDHYAYILTIEDNGSIILDPYINPYALNFYKLYINKSSDLEILNNLKNNSVLSISCNPKLVSEINRLLKSKDNIIEYRLITIYNNSSNNVDELEFKSGDHLQQFIEYVQTKISPSEVLSEEIVKLTSM